MISVGLQIVSMTLCFVGLLQILVGTKWWGTPKRFYQIFFVLLFVYSALIITELLLDGMDGVAIRYTLEIAGIIRGIVAYALIYTLIRQLIFRIDPEKKHMALRYIAHGLLVLQILVFFVLKATHFCYYIDDSNIIHYTDWYNITFVMWVLSLIYIFFLLFKYKNRILPGSWLVFVILSSIAGVAIIFQVFFNEIQFVALSISISVVIFNLYIINERSALAFKVERELDKLKVEMMLSQIQPHFLYNSLTTIKQLCRSNPKEAENAVAEFSVYLRGNMDSLSSEAPIAFIKELEHTRAYLTLEKYRFIDELNIKEQIECTSFALPALTLQPIVENAVCHGIRETENGTGTVTIASREYPDRYEITVSDDGAGFDVSSLEQQDARHLGIRNVRYRLEQLCKGTLTLQSTVGQGTTVIISLPKPMCSLISQEREG